MRPKSLQEVAVLTANGDSFDRCLANFLDGFYAAPSFAALVDSPPLLAPMDSETGRVRDAYLAATAEELSRRLNLPSPDWALSDERRLHNPWFASQLAALRGVLILESPPAFRARNLFVSNNALSRT
ncbi:MAG: hypothetical protein KF791_06960 [Verrucomicrobiae bacterium]|nr:hypothetical protein [Verrucomicrobiae bacterium]